MKTSNAFIARQCDQAGETVEFCAAPQVKSEVDWQAVGRLMEAHNTRQLGAMVGTTNWGARLWRAAQPVQPLPAGASPLPDDFISHKDSWRSALVIAQEHAEQNGTDMDDKAYWAHEMAAFDRAYSELKAGASPQPVQPASERLLEIIAASYQIAGAYEAPDYVLDVLASPTTATQEQIDALLPFAPVQLACLHDETERLGAIWTRCTQCDKKWADDEPSPIAQPVITDDQGRPMTYWGGKATQPDIAQPVQPAPVAVAWVNSSNLISFQIDRERYPCGGGGDLATTSYAKSNYHNTPLFTQPQVAQPVQTSPDNLKSAAQAVLDRWDSPQWKWAKQGPTGELMHDLRVALQKPSS